MQTYKLFFTSNGAKILLYTWEFETHRIREHKDQVQTTVQLGQQLKLSLHSPNPLRYLLAKSASVLELCHTGIKRQAAPPSHLKAHIFSCGSVLHFAYCFQILLHGTICALCPFYFLILCSFLSSCTHLFFFFCIFTGNQQFFRSTNTAQLSFSVIFSPNWLLGTAVGSF